MSVKTVIIIPCYNHGSTIQKVVDGLRFSSLPIILIDDGSDVETKVSLANVASHESHVTLLTLPVNKGKGAAVCEGFTYAIAQNYTHAIQIDADGQHDFNDITTVLTLSKKSPEKMVLGYPVYDSTVPSARQHGRKISNFWTAVITISLQIKDALCGFRCYPLNKIKLIMEKYSIGSRMTFDPSIAIYLYWEGVEAINFPTKVHYPEDGISHFRMVEDNISFSKFFSSHFFRMIPRYPSLLIRSIRRKSSNSWYTLPERGSYLGLKITFFLYSVLGPRLIWLIVHPIVFYFFLTGKEARKASRQYLSLLKQHSPGTIEPSLINSYRHILSFAQAMLDRIAIYQDKGDRFTLNWHNRELIDGFLDKKQGLLLTGAHLGSFELLRLLADERDSEKVHALMYTKHAQLMNRLLESTKRAPIDAISLEDIDLEKMLQMRELISSGEHIGILADRPAVQAEDRVHKVNFLGKEASFPVGPWQLAAFLNAPVLLIFGIRKGNREYDIYCEEFLPSLTEKGKIDIPATTQAYADRVAEYCEKFPYQWFNFYNFWE